MQNSAAECRISYWVYVSGNANGASLLTKLHHYDQETILDFFPTTVDGEEDSDQGWLFTEVVIGRHSGTFSVGAREREILYLLNAFMLNMWRKLAYCVIFFAQFLLDKDEDSTFDAGWAVDDVRLLDCALPTKNDCEEPQEEFQCPSGGCILLDSVCDLQDDCGDGSDEADCCGESGCYIQTDFESEDYPLGDWEIVEVEGRKVSMPQVENWSLSSFFFK